MSSSSSSSSTAATATVERTQRKQLGSVQQVKKFGLVGDGTVGKTTVLLTYTTQSFVKDYVPTVFDNFSVIEDFDDIRVNVILWDTAGQEDYVGVRKICYDNADVYFLCFSLVHPNSFLNIKSKWVPELRQYAPKATLFLVGTKTDLVDDPETLKALKATDEKPITTKAAQALQKEIGAELYLTCSAKSIESVTKVFRDALKYLLDREAKQLEADRKLWAKELKQEEKMLRMLEKMRAKEHDKSDKAAPALTASGSDAGGSTASANASAAASASSASASSTTTSSAATTSSDPELAASSGKSSIKRKKKHANAAAAPATSSSSSTTTTTTTSAKSKGNDDDDSKSKSDDD